MSGIAFGNKTVATASDLESVDQELVELGSFGRSRGGPAVARVTTPLAVRRRTALLVTFIATAAMMVAVGLMRQSLMRPSTLTGGTLLACLIILTAIGLRRRLPGVGLGSMATWTQIHLYTGLFAGAVYLAHVPAVIAGGYLEFWLSIAFLFVSASGFYGLYASRTYPQRIRGGENVSLDRDQLASRATKLANNDSGSAADEVFRNHFEQHLADYFSGQRGLAFRLHPTKRHRDRLVDELRSIDRYLDPGTITRSRSLQSLIEQRDQLDFASVLQHRLRIWVALHASVTMLLIVASIMHVAAVLTHGS